MEPAYKGLRCTGGGAGFAGNHVSPTDLLFEAVLTLGRGGRELAEAMPGIVRRYAMPNLLGLSFAIVGALSGGVHATLKGGLQGQKAAAYVLPNVDIEAP